MVVRTAARQEDKEALERIERVGGRLNSGSADQRLIRAQEIVNLGISRRADSPVRLAAANALLVAIAKGQDVEVERKLRYMVKSLGFKINVTVTENREEHKRTRTYSMTGPIRPETTVPKRAKQKTEEEGGIKLARPAKTMPVRLQPAESEIPHQPPAETSVTLTNIAGTVLVYAVKALNNGIKIMLGPAACGPVPPQTETLPPQPSATAPPTAAPTGSAPAQEAGAPTQTQQVKYWWPGFIMKNGQLITVYMGYGDDTFYDPKDMYASKDAIPQASVGQMKTQIQNLTGYMKQFFSDPATVDKALEGFILMKRPTPNQLPNGTIAAGNYGGTNPIVVVDSDGNVLQEYAGGGKMMDYNQEGAAAGGVLFHEYFHLVWDNLPQAEKDSFKTKASLFFNAYGDTSESDAFFPLLLTGVIDPALNGHSSFNLGSALLVWSDENLPSNMSDAEKQYIRFAIQEYVRIHTNIVDGRTKGLDSSDRSAFIGYETFAYMGANYDVLDAIANQGTPTQGLLPWYMNPPYSSMGLRSNVVDALSNSGAGYFTSEEKFKELIPHIKSFVDWMKVLYPELVTAAQQP